MSKVSTNRANPTGQIQRAIALTVTSNGVLVNGDVSEIADLLNLGSSETQRPEVPKDEVVVGATGLELVVRSVLEDRRGKGLGVLDDLGSVGLELWRGSLLERDGDTGDGLFDTMMA